MKGEDLGGAASFGEAVPSKPPLARTSPAAARLFGINANDSAPPAGGSRGSPFSRGGKQKIRAYCHQSDLPCISENRTAAMGCPVFDGIDVFLCNISAFALAFDGPPTTGHCSLLIANCQLPIRPQKKFPGGRFQNRVRPQTSKFLPPPKIPRRGPPGIPCFAIPYAMMGACAGEGLAGGGLEGPASP